MIIRDGTTNHNIHVYHRAAIAAVDVLKEAPEEKKWAQKNLFKINRLLS